MVKINSVEDLYSSIGYGNVKCNHVITRLKELYEKTLDFKLDENTLKKPVQKKIKKSYNGISIEGVDNVKTRISKCCNPVPGDKIIGFITKGRGISVHRADCPNIEQDAEENRLIEVNWDSKETTSYPADIQIKAIDRSGLVAAIAMKLSEMDVSLLSIDGRTGKDKTVLIKMSIEINDIKQLENILREIKKVKSVMDAYRVTK